MHEQDSIPSPPSSQQEAALVQDSPPDHTGGAQHDVVVGDGAALAAVPCGDGPHDSGMTPAEAAEGGFRCPECGTVKSS
eukprot:8275513-Alexandrium_andersonii.AAC.1